MTKRYFCKIVVIIWTANQSCTNPYCWFVISNITHYFSHFIFINLNSNNYYIQKWVFYVEIVYGGGEEWTLGTLEAVVVSFLVTSIVAGAAAGTSISSVFITSSYFGGASK